MQVYVASQSLHLYSYIYDFVLFLFWGRVLGFGEKVSECCSGVESNVVG